MRLASRSSQRAPATRAPAQGRCRASISRDSQTAPWSCWETQSFPHADPLGSQRRGQASLGAIQQHVWDRLDFPRSLHPDLCETAVVTSGAPAKSSIFVAVADFPLSVRVLSRSPHAFHLHVLFRLVDLPSLCRLHLTSTPLSGSARWQETPTSNFRNEGHQTTRKHREGESASLGIREMQLNIK